jgi:hypothetical protein
MEKPEESPNIGQALLDYLHELDCITECIGPAVNALENEISKAEKEFEKFIADKAEIIEETEDSKRYKFKVENQKEHDSLRTRSRRSRDALTVIPKSLLISMVASYDSFLGKLVRSLYESKPEILNGGERQITYSQLIEFDSIKDAENYILEKEIETLLRKSHSDQFKQLEKDFKIRLQPREAIWKRFIEITERRNLLVHCDGVISSQYLKVCKEHSVNIGSKSTLGSKLHIDPKYFFIAHRVFYEIGLALTHALWRKVLPEQIENADEYLNQSGFDLLAEKNYSLSKVVFEFASQKLPKHSTEQYRLMFLVNLCIAYIQTEEKEKALALLDSEDWSAKSEDFQLANSVLREEFEEAAKMMTEISISKITKRDYTIWPLFENFRDTEEFQKAYEEKFNEPFTLSESSNDDEESETE